MEGVGRGDAYNTRDTILNNAWGQILDKFDRLINVRTKFSSCLVIIAILWRTNSDNNIRRLWRRGRRQ